MASRHDIISITFQANAGKANVALQTLQTEAQKSRDKIVDLKRQLDEGLRANLPTDQIQKIRDDIKQAEKEVKQWDNAYKELAKGVRTLDEAVKQFNAGTLGQMSAAFNKAAANAAKLAQTKMTPGTQEWKEMDALIVEAQSNVLKATADINGLVAAIKKGGTSTKSTLTQAKSDLEQLLTLEVRGSKEWNTYDAQLKVVTGELNKLAEAERKAAQADQVTAMNKRMRSLKTESASGLEEMKRFWQTMVAGAENGSAELAKYEENLKKVIGQERKRTAASAEQVISSPSKYGIDQMRAAVQEMTKIRDGMQKGIPMWQHYNKLVKEGEAYLADYAEREKIARGEAISLRDAFKVGLQGLYGKFKGTTEQLKQARKALEEQLAVTDKGTKRYDQLRRALEGVALEEMRVGQLTKETQAILDSPKGKSFNELKQAVEQGRAALASMRIETGKDREAFDELAAKVKRADFEMKQLGATSKGTASSFAKAMSRLKTYITLYVSAATALQKVTASFADLLELSDKMGEVRKTTGFTADEVGRLSENLRKMDTRTTITGLLELSVAAGQLGLKTQADVEGFTEAANKLMVALPEMGKEGATEMLKVALATGEIAKIDKQMRKGLIDGSSATAVAMEKVGSTIDRLRATSAATAPAITDFVKRVGAVGAQSGITIDQVAALGSTVDALGMRVEMSATALSRMIPAIKNNAFEVAKAIKVAPNELRDLFATGRGMEAILMIFQHIKDAGLDDEGIEKMLGMGGMQDVMKQLNQQGARAGIVFAGLSQNVEELRRQLGVAGQAYEENIAIQQEYDKMNETTAAKWERFKNQLEETFVNDKNQRWLGGVIDNLRVVLDILVILKDVLTPLMLGFGAWKLGIGGAIWTYLINPLNTAITSTKSLGTAITGVVAKWRAAWKAMDAASKANLFIAIASGVFMLVKTIWDAINSIDAMALSLAKLDNEEAAAEREVDRLTSSLQKAIPKANEAANKHSQLKKETEDLRKEVDTLKNSTDKSTDSHDKLSKKEEELKQKEKELKSASDEMNKANKTRSGLIAEINSKYSTYLGYMLNEKTAAEQVALAHLQIVDALKEELEQKRLNKEIEGVEGKHNEGIEKAGARSAASLASLPEDMQRQIRSRWNTVRGSIRYSVDENGRESYTLPAIEGLTSGEVTKGSYAELRKELEKAFGKIVRTEVDRANKVKGRDGKGTRLDFGSSWQVQGSTQYGSTNYGTVSNTLDNFISQAFKSFDQWTEKTLKREAEIEEKRQESEAFVKGVRTTSISDANKMNEDAWNRIILQMIGGTDNMMKNVDELAQQVNIITANFSKFNGELKNADRFIGKGKDVTVENVVNTIFKADTEEHRKQIINAAKQAQKGEAGGMGEGGGAGSGRSIWGTEPEATSTEYSLMSVDELVARRNQMDRFKNALRPDTDIRKALAEDVALMKAINDGKVQPNMKDVVDWYNTERKKIEQELKSEKYSTNEGHWAAEAKTGKRKNMMPETDYALAELDRYYSRRKEKLEKARIDENMSEELYNRQAELLEQEHLERRAKLRGSFTGEISKEETKAFDEWWKSMEKNFELDKLERDKITAEWAKANAGQIGRNNYRMQQDMTKMEEITVKHLNRIADIVAKERPYDGIVANLRKNLTEMDILFADMEKKGETDPAKLVKAEAERMRFLLSEAENAYALTFDELAKKMREKGMGDWADSLIVDDQKRQSILEALHKVYDDVQNAIKKEAAQIKKNVDIMWQDVMPGKNTSLKDSYELAISSLGLEEGNVSRANSLIGAGAASERVVDKLAIQQMKLKITMQEHYYNLIEAEGRKRIAFLEHEAELEKKKAERLKKEAEELKKMSEELKSQGKLEESQLKAKDAQLKARKAEEALTKSVEASLDKQHLTTSLNISQAKELTEIEKQRNEILARTEESQNRLYRELREWGDLIASSLQGVMEASNAGNAEYYNERAKMDLTGKGGPGAGTYIIIEDEGTSDATAHYEYLDERAALERQHEIEQQNAQAEAWKKLSDDLNMKMSEQITDWMNAAALDANTAAVMANTDAILRSMEGSKTDFSDASKLKRDENGMALDSSGSVVYPIQPTEEGKAANQEGITSMWQTYAQAGSEAMTQMSEVIGELPNPVPDPVSLTPETAEIVGENAAAVYNAAADAKISASERETEVVVGNAEKQKRATKDAADQEARSTQSSFSKMIAACNLYGIAYQTMSNENLSTAQKFQAFALQAAGQAAISALTMEFTKVEGENTVRLPGILGKLLGEMPYPAAMATFAGVTALMGTMMALAMSAVTKSKSQISQISGASASAGRQATGMMTYADGNVNEFTDPGTLTPGRSYNVDAADGRTYRARYMGSNPSTHLTNGPEFHLAGERGREMIIDAGTTRQITMNENEIWHAIQTLSAGGRMPTTRRRGRGVRAFADGNVEDFEEMGSVMGDGMTDTGMGGFSPEMAAQMQASLDRNSEVMERVLEQGIHAYFDVYGKDGVVHVYDNAKKTLNRHGERY